MVNVIDLGSGFGCTNPTISITFFFYFNKFKKITGMFVNILLKKIRLNINTQRNGI